MEAGFEVNPLCTCLSTWNSPYTPLEGWRRRFARQPGQDRKVAAPTRFKRVAASLPLHQQLKISIAMPCGSAL
jgi:hypothetical protein